MTIDQQNDEGDGGSILPVQGRGRKDQSLTTRDNSLVFNQGRVIAHTYSSIASTLLRDVAAPLSSGYFHDVASPRSCTAQHCTWLVNPDGHTSISSAGHQQLWAGYSSSRPEARTARPSRSGGKDSPKTAPAFAGGLCNNLRRELGKRKIETVAIHGVSIAGNFN